MLDTLWRLCEGEEGEEGEDKRAPNGTPTQDSTWLRPVRGIEHLRTASDQEVEIMLGVKLACQSTLRILILTSRSWDDTCTESYLPQRFWQEGWIAH